MKKWLVPLIGLTIALALGTVGAVTAFALTSDGGSDNPQVPHGGDTAGEVLHGDPTYDEWIIDFGDGIGDGKALHGDPSYDERILDFGDGKVLTSADGIDPELILEPSSPMKPICVDFGCGIGDGKVLHGDPTYEEWLSNYKPTQDPVTSIDEIDPNVCNLVHNINVCTPEDLEEAFGALTDIASVETHGRTEPVVGQVVASSIDEGNLEPFFVDSEPRYTVQSLKEAVEQDCDLAGGTVYVTSGGELGCVVAHNLEDSGEEMVSSSQPPTIEPLPAPVTQ